MNLLITINTYRYVHKAECGVDLNSVSIAYYKSSAAIFIIIIIIYLFIYFLSCLFDCLFLIDSICDRLVPAIIDLTVPFRRLETIHF